MVFEEVYGRHATLCKEREKDKSRDKEIDSRDKERDRGKVREKTRIENINPEATKKGKGTTNPDRRRTNEKCSSGRTIHNCSSA
jgi:hypothetical protein